MSTVLWGGRRGDVQYGSRDFWRRTIPIDPKVRRVVVSSAAYFDVGDLLDVTQRRVTAANAIVLLSGAPFAKVVGLERGTNVIGVLYS